MVVKRSTAVKKPPEQKVAGLIDLSEILKVRGNLKKPSIVEKIAEEGNSLLQATLNRIRNVTHDSDASEDDERSSSFDD